MKIIEALKKCSSVIVSDKRTNKKTLYLNVHLVETPSWRYWQNTMTILRGDNKQYKSCLIADLSVLKTDKDYNNEDGIWVGENKYLFVS